MLFNLLLSIVGIIITILLIVGIHELGHFLVAKACGIKVLRFSIGFGKALWKRCDKQGTEYVFAAIPLGGYVKMLDESEGDVPPDQVHLAFNRQAYWKKMAVVAAGPLMNLLFAFVIYWALFTIGFVSIAPVIGNVTKDSIAAEAHLQPQQEIIAIENKPMHNWMSVIVDLLGRAGETRSITFSIQSPGSTTPMPYHLNLTTWHMDDLRPDPLASLGIEPYEPTIPAIVGNVLSDSPAAKAGLKSQDEIIKIDNVSMKDYIDVVTQVYHHADDTLTFTVKRNNHLLTLPVTIGHKRTLFLQKHGYIGISSNFEWPKALLHVNKYSATQALARAGQEVMTFTNLNLIILGKMVTGKISLKSLGGPITIFESAGSALNNGFIAFSSFLAFLSISIGVINILPVPGLDGGHLLFQTIESIMRRPLSQRSQLFFFRLGLAFLLLIMIQALMNDIWRL